MTTPPPSGFHRRAAGSFAESFPAADVAAAITREHDRAATLARDLTQRVYDSLRAEDGIASTEWITTEPTTIGVELEDGSTFMITVEPA